MSTELRQALDRVARRFRRVRLFAGLTVCWLVWAAVGFLLASRPVAADGRLLLGFAALAATTAAACAAIALRSVRDRRWVARRIEARHSDLAAGLLAAVEEDAAGGRPDFLRESVIRAAVAHDRRHDWDTTVPAWQVGGTTVAHAAALSLLILVVFSLAGQARSRPADRLAPLAGSAITPGVTVEPGTVEIERGAPLLVVARFGDAVPAEATLVVEPAAPAERADNESSTGQEVPAVERRAMSRSLEDPAFAGRVPAVTSDLSYRVEFAGGASETYRVTVFDYPAVERTDADLAFPSYTGQSPKTVEDVRHVTAVEGTTLTLRFRLNKPVAAATLTDEAGAAVPLAAEGADGRVYAATFTLAESRKLRVGLVDADGRADKRPTEIAVNVTRNKPAAVATARPSRDVRVSPIEELALEAKATDDFGVVRRGLSYTVAGREPRDVVLDGEPAKKVEAAHLLAFEPLGVAPDELVTYHFWAEDVGPDGQTRRSLGDMFFAEVRPFEEVFRQGEQPPGGAEGQQQQGQQGGGAAEEAMQLAELQKQVINATWTLLRRESPARPTVSFPADATVVAESQRSALEQAAALGEKLTDATSKANLDQATGLMNEAAEHLARAAAPDVAALTPALAAEQAAYAALLRLRDREFEVVRNQQQRQQGSGGSAGSPFQRQLQQLELTNDENRYEQQRTAEARQQEQSARDREQQENRQVLNRLAELARRQGDLNDRLKELQAALEAAADDQAREELRRQLKRLREQEQEILRDTDELQERMEQEQNRDRMAEAREAVEQSRERVRQASEALEEGRLSQAINEGTRAGRQLEEVKDDLRKETAERFSDEIKEMRDAGRELAGNQERLSERLDALGEKPTGSLRGDDGRAEIKQGLERQAEELSDLLDRMRRTVQEAEEAEPLLAQELFDATRKAEQKSIGEALDAAERLTDLGIAPDAAEASRQAGAGLDELRDGLDRAARSVLGDETEALRRARGELDDLADAIDREIAQAGGEPVGRRSDEGEAGGRSGETDAESSPPNFGPSPPRGSDRDGRDPQTGSRRGEPSDRGERPSETEAGGERPDAGEPTEGRRPGDAPGDGREPQSGGGRRGPGERRPSQDGADPETRGGDRGQNRPGEDDRPGEAAGERSRPGEGRTGESGRRPSDEPPGREDRPERNGRPQGGGEGTPMPGGGERDGQPGQGQPGQGQPRQGRPNGNDLRGGNEPRSGQAGRPGGEDGLERLIEGFGGATAGGPNAGGPQIGGPITGEGFREWSDRMRDVEELVDAPDLRAEAARIRDRVRGAREEFKRHSKEPDPNALRELVAEPLHELRERVAEEVRRRESPDSLVPIDRDPVPPAFAEEVRRYYERLGTGR